MARTTSTGGRNTTKGSRTTAAKGGTGQPRKNAAANQKQSAKGVQEMTAEELVVANFATLTAVIDTLGKTLDLLLQKTENMAYHIIATEETLAELVAENGLNLARVNERIRSRIDADGNAQINYDSSIDIAAAMASPKAKIGRLGK